MRTLVSALFLIASFHAPGALRAQALPDPAEAYPVGLSLSYGIGAYGVRDEAISTERYDGTLPYLDISWARYHGRHVYRVGMEWRSSDEIRNHTIDTEITRFAIGQVFLYPLATTRVLGRDVGLFLGPTMDVTVLLNEQHIAVHALGFAQSVAGLVSLGIRGDAVLPASSRLKGLASLRTSVVSLGIRAVDDETDETSPAKLLILPSGVSASLEIGAAYQVSGHVSVGLDYLFELDRITAWDPLFDASDSLVGRVTWRF